MTVFIEIAVGLLAAGVVAFAVINAVRRKKAAKKGGGSSCCNCSRCSFKGTCCGEEKK